jgi:hypothetical protein
MTSYAGAAVAAVALTAVSADAQTHPDFSGTWTMDRERSESLHQSAPIEPSTLAITQTDAELTIETRRSTSTTRSAYKIVPKTAPGEPGQAVVSRAYWDGDALVTEGARTVQGQTVSVRETRTLNADRTEMTVQTLLVVQHGYSFRGAKNYGASKDVFRRVVP